MMQPGRDGDARFLAGIRAVADELAAPNAGAVDAEARFPAEATDGLREMRALSALLPQRLGGDDVSFRAIAAASFELGRRCAATAMVFAMHQIQVATVLRHLEADSWFEAHLGRLAAEQRLVASVTSEIGTGGDMGRSVAAVTAVDGGGVRFEKQAPTVSYGEHADDFLTTLRRAEDADGGDQVAALTRRDQMQLQTTSTWDPMGMRGTCSPGFVVQAEFEAAQVMPGAFAQVARESMVPVSHILWSHVWLGIATDAFDRARAFVRASARKQPGQVPPAAQRLSRAMSGLTLLRAEVELGLRDFEEADREWLSTMGAALRFNNLKLGASEHAPVVCQAAMAVSGIMGFRNDTPYSVGRHLRDAMSGSLMVANDRIHETDASLLLIAKDI